MYITGEFLWSIDAITSLDVNVYIQFFFQILNSPILSEWFYNIFLQSQLYYEDFSSKKRLYRSKFTECYTSDLRI